MESVSKDIEIVTGYMPYIQKGKDSILNRQREDYNKKKDPN